MPHSKISERRISLVVGTILTVVTLLVGITVFTVMQRHADALLIKSLQSSLDNRVELSRVEIRDGMSKAVSISTRPLLINRLVRVNARADDVAARSELNLVARSFVQNGLSVVSLYGEDGKELAHAGLFTQRPELVVPLNLPGHVQLLWKDKFLLQASVDILKAGRVVGKVKIETDLPELGNTLKEAKSIGETGELALCAPFGLKMQCFPTTLYPHVQTLSLRPANGNLLPMTHALTGETGFVTTLDYRAHEVVAAYAPVGDLGLGMVLKMDSAELYAPVWHQLRHLIPLLLGVVIIALLLLRWLLTPLVVRLIRSEAEAVQHTTALTEEIAEHRLAEAEVLRFKNVLDNTLDMIFMFEPESLRFVYVNQGAVLSMNYSREELLGMTPYQIKPLIPEQNFRQLIAPLLSGEQSSLRFDTMHRRKDDTDFPVSIFIQQVKERDGSGLFVAIVSDITERRQAEADQRIAASAFESQESLIITDADGVILRVNQAFTKTTGYTAEEVVGQTPSLLKSGRHDADFYRAMWKTIHRSGKWQGEIWDRRKNGEIYPKWLTISAVKDANGGVTHYVGSHLDITERKAAEEKIRHLAFYDSLTQLPNRRLLMDRLQQALAASARSGRSGALLFLDLDNFKSLNDTLGHGIGDLLLQQVAQRLESCVRESDTVARLGGDEFVVVLEALSYDPLEAAEQAEAIGEKILATLYQPYRLATQEYQSSASIGVVLFNGQQSSLEELLKQADIAMYQAKKAGRNTVRFFDPKMQAAVEAHAVLSAELHQAVEKQQFQLHYQIQVDDANRPLGAEVLIRWIHPERGFVSPAQFIPLAEETDLILHIGGWVLDTACAQLKAWQQDALTRDLSLSVNVSARQFRQADFLTQVQAAVQKHGIKPDLLKLELTESALAEDIERIIEIMNALKEVGIRFSLDDFGTGFSSLQYLRQLPLAQLKIDQSFVIDMNADSDNTIVQTIIAMAKSLKLGVIAEGVETEKQRQLLSSYGCQYYQGYLFSKPIPIEQFEALLKQG